MHFIELKGLCIISNLKLFISCYFCVLLIFRCGRADLPAISQVTSALYIYIYLA
jgi:hypothetical protein